MCELTSRMGSGTSPAAVRGGDVRVHLNSSLTTLSARQRMHSSSPIPWTGCASRCASNPRPYQAYLQGELAAVSVLACGGGSQSPFVKRPLRCEVHIRADKNAPLVLREQLLHLVRGRPIHPAQHSSLLSAPALVTCS